MGTSTAGLLWKGLSKDDGGSFREKTVGACSHSERLLIAVNGLLQVFRQDHRRGIMIRNSSQKRRGWTLSCNQQDFQEICERCEAKHPPVMFPAIKVVWQPGSRGQIRCQRKNDKKSKKSVSLISDTCGCEKMSQPYSCGINAMRKEVLCFIKLNIKKERIRK